MYKQLRALRFDFGSMEGALERLAKREKMPLEKIVEAFDKIIQEDCGEDPYVISVHCI